MSISPITIDPESIKNLGELEEILITLNQFKREYEPGSTEVGILKMQSRSQGAYFIITTKESADQEIKKPVTRHIKCRVNRVASAPA